MRFYLLGNLRIESERSDSTPIPLLPRLRKTQNLLSYLLLFHDSYHSRDHLTELFWGDKPDVRARNNLSHALGDLRTLLGESKSGAYIEADRNGAQLNLGGEWLDVAVLRQGLASADLATISSAISLYTSDLLPEWSDAWCVEAREQLRQSVLRSGTELLKQHLSRQEWQEGVDLARKLLPHDPFDEALHEIFLRLLLGAGLYSEARRHYEGYAALLRREIDADPAANTQQLYSLALHLGATSPASTTIASAAIEATPGLHAALQNAGAKPERGRSIRLPFVGRTPQLVKLRQAIDTARRGQGGIVFIAGEAGVGKSRLVEEALSAAGRLRVARGRAYAAAHEVPFALLLDPLRTWLLNELAPEQLLSRLGQVTLSALSQVIPLLPARIKEAGLRAIAPLPSLPPAEARVRLLQSVSSALRAAAAPGSPVALFLDDLQWADSNTLHVLEQLRGQLQNVPLLIIATYRSDEVPANSFLSQLIGSIGSEIGDEDASLIELEPLDSAETRHMVEARIPAEHALLSRWLFERSRGNPFYLSQLLRALYEEGHATPDALSGGWRLVENAYSLPSVGMAPATPGSSAGSAPLRAPGVRQAVIERFSRLSAPTQALLRVASVIGEECEFDLLAQATGLEEEEAFTALEESLGRRFLQQRDDLFGLSHDLIREALYESLSLPRLRRIHEQVGSALEANDTIEKHNARHLLKLAYHYGHSANKEKQRHFFRIAAESAQAEYANEASIEYWERLLPLLNKGELVPVLLKLREVYTHVGKPEKAEELCRQAVQIAQSLQNGELHAQALSALANVLSRRGELVEAVEVGRTAYSLQKSLDDGRALAEVAGVLGNALWLAANYEETITLFNEQLQIGTKEGDDKIVSQALASLGNVHTDLGRHEEAREYLSKAADLAVKIGAGPEACRVYWSLAYSYTLQGKNLPAIANFQHAVRIGLDIGYAVAVHVSLSGMGVAYNQYGLPEEAFLCRVHDLAYSVAANNKLQIAVALNNLAHTQDILGHRSESEQNFKRAIALAETSSTTYVLFEINLQAADRQVYHGCYSKAQPFVQRATELVEAAEHPELQLDLELLTLQVGVELGEMSVSEVLARCVELLEKWPNEPEQAAILFTTWKIDPAQSAAREKAAELYQSLEQRGPALLNRQRYCELTGENLPEPAPPPPISDFLLAPLPKLEELLAAADMLISRTSAGPPPPQ